MIRSGQAPGEIFNLNVLILLRFFAPLEMTAKRDFSVKHYLLYRANSTALVSLITVTLISPGYVISFSIFFAISLAKNAESESFNTPDSIITRISRPA